jgi:hypothetical protein
MSAAVHGRAEVSRYLAELPEQLKKVLGGAGRAGGKVVGDEARRRCRSAYVAERIVTKGQVEADHIRVTVTVKRGYARSIATWLEYGTSPHFISVDNSVRQGMTAGRINRNATADHKATLIINGKPVGGTVFHRGADPYPFLRPAREAKRTEAIAAAGSYIASRIIRGNVVPEPETPEGSE